MGKEGVVMKLSSLILGVFGMLIAGQVIAAEVDLNLVPWPKSVEVGNSAMMLGQKARIVVGEKMLTPLGTILADEIYMATGLRFEVVEGAGKAGDVELVTSDKLSGEAYRITVTDRATVTGGNYGAVAMGTVTHKQDRLANFNTRCHLPVVRVP